MITDQTLLKSAYNAHEHAEAEMLAGLHYSLSRASDEALMGLADPQWNWETRSSLSPWIVEMASQELTSRLNKAVA